MNRTSLITILGWIAAVSALPYYLCRVEEDYYYEHALPIVEVSSWSKTSENGTMEECNPYESMWDGKQEWLVGYDIQCTSPLVSNGVFLSNVSLLSYDTPIPLSLAGITHGIYQATSIHPYQATFTVCVQKYIELKVSKPTQPVPQSDSQSDSQPVAKSVVKSVVKSAAKSDQTQQVAKSDSQPVAQSVQTPQVKQSDKQSDKQSVKQSDSQQDKQSVEQSEPTVRPKLIKKLPVLSSSTNIHTYLQSAKKRHERLQQRIRDYHVMTEEEKKRFNNVSPTPARLKKFNTNQFRMIPDSKRVVFYTSLIKYYQLQMNLTNHKEIQPYLDQAIYQLQKTQNQTR